MKSIYLETMAVRLAVRCKKGNVSAMRAMAENFRSRCTPPLAALLDCYEADPVPENEEKIRDYLKNYFQEESAAKAYMMWLVRATLYGDKEVAGQLERWPFYKKFAYIPYDMMIGNGNFHIKFWSSNKLREIGFIDVPRNRKECSLSYDINGKYFSLCYVSSYEPPDETGFGAEWEYSDIYFDEFFRRLPKKPGGK